MKQIEYIEWDDAFYNEGPLQKDKITNTPMRLHDVGFLVKENEQMVFIAMEMDPETDYWRYIVAIPKKYIVSRLSFDCPTGEEGRTNNVIPFPHGELTP